MKYIITNFYYENDPKTGWGIKMSINKTGNSNINLKQLDDNGDMDSSLASPQIWKIDLWDVILVYTVAQFCGL